MVSDDDGIVASLDSLAEEMSLLNHPFYPATRLELA
jgi:hypothetical protein